MLSRAAGTTRVVLVVVFAAAVLAMPGTAAAHAALVASDPSANAVLPASPPAVRIEFSERIVEGASWIHVLNAAGERVDLDDPARDPFDTSVLTVSVRPGLPDGIYTVAWRNISDVDGHPITGSFVFHVGEGGVAAPPVEEGEQSLFASPGEPLVRWVTLLGGMLLAGAPFAYAVVLAPAATGDGRALRARIEAVAVAGGVAMLVASGVHLALQSASSGLALTDLLSDTTWGRAWVLRVGLAALSLAAFAGVVSGRGRASVLRPAGMAFALGALAAISLASHAAATAGVELAATLVDVAHIAAAAAWGGGLVAFLLAAAAWRVDADHLATLRRALPRFSVLGITSTAALAITGAYSAWLQTVTASALGTPYGRGVLVKVALLVALTAVAAVNLSWVRRRLGGGDAGAATWLRRLMRVEVAGIVLAVAAGATIASLEPARQVEARREVSAGAIHRIEATDRLVAEVSLRPADVGENELAVQLRREGDAYTGASTVQATLTFLDADLAPQEVTLEGHGGGHWAAPEPVLLTVEGEYEAAVLIQRTDGFDVRDAFRFRTGGAVAVAQASPSTAWRLAIVALTSVGLIMIAAAIFGRRRGLLRGDSLAWAGAGVCAVAFILAGRVPDDVASAANPVVANAASLAAGETLFVTHCAACHGEGGAGDGPDAAGLALPPAPLVEHVPLHTDAELFRSISLGIPSLGMPAWRDALTEQQRWHLVNYLRVLAQDSATAEASTADAAAGGA